MGDTAGTGRSIFQEKAGLTPQGNQITQAMVEAQNLSLQGFSVDGIKDYEDEDGDSVDKTGTPNGTAPYAMSEFYSYNHNPFAWSTSVIYAPSDIFNINRQQNYGALAKVSTQVTVQWNSNNSHTVKWRDVFANAFSSTTYSSTTAFTTTVNPSQLEIRWRFVNYSLNVTTGADSNDVCNINYHSTNASPFNGGQYSGSQSLTNQNYTGPWLSVPPSAFGGNNADEQSSYVQLSCTGGNSEDGDGLQILIPANTSSKYLALEYRANQDNNHIISFRNNVAAGVNIQANSYYDIPDFTCIMPNMLVMTEDGEKRVGDVVVGDKILAQKDLNIDDNDSSNHCWTEVTETRTHKRSGYWDVGGIHITNDHPVWLTDDTHSAWVKVEDMREEIERTYVGGNCEPVYLGTDPGWYYVFSEDKNKVFTVSGDYAPFTE